MSWTESRQNPNFSRFDAVNNKHEQYIETINIRAVLPPLINYRLYDKWFYIHNNLSSVDTMMEIC